ncbi:ATP-binding protein [Candidatus Hydrogenosomobacter endosymbioticus]|nr:ATP-binding protein [Candidatus Hydrogenosomobacter endosymbioticus]
MFWRSVIIIIAPIVAMNLISGYVFFDRHWNPVTRLFSRDIAREISVTMGLITNSDMPKEDIHKIALDKFDMTISEETFMPPKSSHGGLALRFFKAALSQEVRHSYVITQTHKFMYVWIKADSGVFKFEIPKKRFASKTSLLFFLWSVGSAVILLVVAIIFMKNQLKPLYRLSRWADSIKDSSLPAHISKIEGAAEIRKVANAVQIMVIKMKSTFEERSNMLMGISHDLRTVLTRMKLQIKLMPASQDADALLLDIDQMNKMIESYIEFAGCEKVEEFRLVNLVDVLERVARPYSNVFIKSEASNFAAMLRVIQFTRCIQNLLDNCLRYAKSSIFITVGEDRGWFYIRIEDDGPGIEEQFRDDVFKPFFKVDKGRMLDGATAGLGLAIVKGIVENHRGQIKIEEAASGGAVFVIKIPATIHSEEAA